MTDWKWTDGEKRVARRAFEKALSKELTTVREKMKQMAAVAAEPEDLWQIADYLSNVRREIDRKYDYRYSVLMIVFARLMREGWLSEEDIDSLSSDKIQAIKHIASL